MGTQRRLRRTRKFEEKIFNRFQKAFDFRRRKMPWNRFNVVVNLK